MKYYPMQNQLITSHDKFMFQLINIFVNLMIKINELRINKEFDIPHLKYLGLSKWNF